MLEKAETICRGPQELWKIRLKGKSTRKEKWHESNKIPKVFLHLLPIAFGDKNALTREF